MLPIISNFLLKLVFISSLISLCYTKAEFCRILALQGGGDKGSYQTGALQAIVDNLPQSDIEWDIVSGISVGSINAFAISLFPKGQEKEALDYMVSLWEDIKGPSDIYENWNIFGVIYGIFFESGAYNNKPLRNYLEKASFNKTIQRTLTIGATSVLNGVYHRFQNMTKTEAIEAVMASSAYPGAFPPNNISGVLYSDGGISYSIDVSAAIDLCKSRGYEETKITIDVVLCNRDEMDWDQKVITYKVIVEALSLMMHEFRLRDIEQIRTKYPGTKFRYFVEPSKLIGDLIPLNFNPQSIRDLLKLGYEDALNIIKQGEGIYFENMILNKKKQNEINNEKLAFLK